MSAFQATGLPPDDRRIRFLIKAGRIVSASLDVDSTLTAVAEASVPDIADICSLHCLDEEGELQMAALAVADPKHRARCEAFVAHRPPSIDDPVGIGQVAREGKTVYAFDVTPELARQQDSPEAAELVAALGLRSTMLVPIPGLEGPIGALSLSMAWSGRTFTEEDVQLAQDLATRAAGAIENARLHDRLRRLQRMTGLLARARTPEEVARVLVEVASPTVGARSGVVSVLDASGRSLVLVRAHDAPAPLVRPFATISIDADLPVAQAVREGSDIYVSSEAELRSRWSDARDAKVQNASWAILALADREGKPFGAVWFGFRRPRTFTASQREHLRAMADHGAEALVRARLEASAVLRQELLESQSEAGLDGIFFQDNEGRPAFHNRRLLQIFGVDADVPHLATLEERLARSLQVVADPRAFSALARRMEELPEATHRFDLRLVDGRILDAYTAPVRAPTGERLGRAWYYRDVTEARRTQEDLVETRRQLSSSEKLAAMGTLVSGVAHEIRTPLAYMGNHAELLLRGTTAGVPPERLETSARAIQEGVERINGLVGTLRRFARVERATTACEVDAVVESAARLFGSARRDEARIALDLSSGAQVKADRLQVQQVIINLLENASDASPPEGRIRVTTRRERDEAAIAVEDEGPGIPPEVADHMFEPFFTTKPGGTGLGLAIVRRIVETHGGRIVVGRALAGGARIEVRLPAMPPREA